MRLHGIQAKNFMSLQLFAMGDLDPDLNIIVGPNGSGKSSVFRAIRALIDGARCVGTGQPFDDGRFLCTRSTASDEFEVALDVEFDTKWEQELIATYLCAAVTHPDDVRNTFSSLETSVMATLDGMALYANWLLDILRPETMAFLFRGQLRFFYRRFVRDDLRLTYTIQVHDTPVIISMAPQFSHYGLFSAGYPPTALQGNNPPIGSVLLTDWKLTNQYHEIREMLLGNRPDAQVLPGAFDMAQFVLRLAGANAVLDVKTLPRSRSPYPGPHKRLNELADRPFDEQQSVMTFGELMHALLSRSIIMTNNFRHPPERVYTYVVQEAPDAASGIYDDRQIPLRLFRLKNGDRAAGQIFCAIQHSFSELAGDTITFDIVTSLTADGLEVEIWTVDNGVEIPIVFHGAGIWEALVLSALLHENAGKVILLDEPASNLHANLQRRFVGAINRAQTSQSGRQAIIVTHSQHLLPTRARDLPKIRRLRRVDSSTAVFGLGPHSNVSRDKLEKEMSDGSDLAGLLFASGVVLVEGATETAALSVWYPSMSASEGRTFADDNIALYCVGGKPNFPLHLHYLEEFGIPWVVICDADALNPALSNAIWNPLNELGRVSELPTSNDFTMLKQLAAVHGVFTANTALTETKGFEDIPQIKQFLDTNPSARDRSKARQGRVIAHNMQCPPGVEETIQAALAWLHGAAMDAVRQRARSQERKV